MRPQLLLLLFLISGFASARAEPEPPPHVVFKPTFLMAADSFSAGTAFIAKDRPSDRPVLVTCHHLFGPSGGLESQMSADDVQKHIVAVAGVSLSDSKSTILTGRYIPVAGAKTMDNDGCDKDLALFEVLSTPTALPIAVKASTRGDKVWLLARVVGSTRLELHPATVSFVSAREVRYIFERADLELRATSGTPILSAKGEVVAINLGGGKDKGQLFGIGNPAASIVAVLRARN